MFEHDQEAVESLLANDPQFRRLYDKHARLKQTINAMQGKSAPADQLALEQMKKEKLLLKDEMAGMIRHYRELQLRTA